MGGERKAARDEGTGCFFLYVQIVEIIDQKSVAKRIWERIQHFIDESHFIGQIGAGQAGAGS